MTGAGALVAIEAHVRHEDPSNDATLVIRAGPLTVQKLVEHARRQQRDYSYRGEPMASVSVAATIGDWTLERILRERLWSRSTYATTVATVRQAGFELLPRTGCLTTTSWCLQRRPSTQVRCWRCLALAKAIPSGVGRGDHGDERAH